MVKIITLKIINMFKIQCFIRKNTPELRDYLISLGQLEVAETPSEPWIDKNGKHHGGNVCEKNIIASQWHKYFGTTRITPDIKRLYFDCGQNEELFKALAAARDDSDYMQWFVCDEPINIYNNKVLYIGDYFQVNDDKFDGSIVSHKATVEELVIHFKNKQKTNN